MQCGPMQPLLDKNGKNEHHADSMGSGWDGIETRKSFALTQPDQVIAREIPLKRQPRAVRMQFMIDDAHDGG